MRRSLHIIFVFLLCFQISIVHAGEAEETFNKVIQAPFRVLHEGFKAVDKGKDKLLEPLLPQRSQESQGRQGAQSSQTGNVPALEFDIADENFSRSAVAGTSLALTPAMAGAEAFEMARLMRTGKALVAFVVLKKSRLGLAAVGVGAFKGWKLKKSYDQMTEEERHLLFLRVATEVFETGQRMSIRRAKKKELFCSRGEKMLLLSNPSVFSKARPYLPFVGKKKGELSFGDMDSYENLRKKNSAERKGLERDHIPSFAAIRLHMRERYGNDIRGDNIRKNTSTIAVSTLIHGQGRTYRYNNSDTVVKGDAANLKQATIEDIAVNVRNVFKEVKDPVKIGRYLFAIAKLVERNFLICLYTE